ncbi:hypothetical protein GK047_05285 [Paenibacillus sp. SYP-B3998]|uniref:Spore coat protein B n=1 Tax=Paenibacillus sp. SYP-B3998 TaxID=2678564 RepID=A0A6G3ZTN9_9BACL|nr:hypothetical protein [Paenibacillus sp. SYP-B3998]NEW05430.1 hypothetical protein [Paenibacillus sp. SYP-B3998]
MSINYLNQLVGKEVRINRGGPDAIVGKLLSIQQDFLVLQAKDGSIVYIQFQHIKSISETKSNVSSSYSSHSHYETSHNFHSLLTRLNHSFVQINRGGPEKFDAFIVESSSDYLLLVVNNEVVRVPVFHIRSISVVGNQGSKGNKSSSANKSSSNKNSSNKSSANKSSANKSSAGRNSTVKTSTIKTLWKKSRIL